MDEPDYSKTAIGMTDADVHAALVASIRLMSILSVIGAVAFWWLKNWQSAVLLIVGSAISLTSLWEWLRLMTAINHRMDSGGTPRPMGVILIGFFVRLGLTVAVLYVSLKFLRGTVLALAIGLGLGLISLSVEAFRLLKHTSEGS
jgi:hypothetical protein